MYRNSYVAEEPKAYTGSSSATDDAKQNPVVVRRGVGRRPDIARVRHAAAAGEAVSIKNPDPADIEHWIKVYTELVGFKERLLAQIGSQRDTVEAEGRLEVQHDDMIFRREHGRLKRRLNCWLNERKLKSD